MTMTSSTESILDWKVEVVVVSTSCHYPFVGRTWAYRYDRMRVREVWRDGASPEAVSPRYENADGDSSQQ
jgi:hypothetical protein